MIAHIELSEKQTLTLFVIPLCICQKLCDIGGDQYVKLKKEFNIRDFPHNIRTLRSLAPTELNQLELVALRAESCNPISSVHKITMENIFLLKNLDLEV